MSGLINFHPRFPMAHTFSIIARDPDSGEMGVAVQSHWFSVGSVVAWGKPGVGVVATQSMVEVSYGPRGLSLMEMGVSAPAALQVLLEIDDGRELRQVAMIDSENRLGVHTGKRCIQAAGHVRGDGFSVQANMMVNDQVWPAMAEAYEGTKGNLVERMMAAMDAAQAVGGDIRGQQSACLLVVSGKRPENPWQGVMIDLRVEDHPEPLKELRRLITVQSAYTLMNQGDAYLGEGNVQAALEAYSSAAALAPDMDELPFWHAVTLAELGRMAEAEPIFKQVFQTNAGWADLVQRLPAAGLLRDDPDLLTSIQALKSE